MENRQEAEFDIRRPAVRDTVDRELLDLDRIVMQVVEDFELRPFSVDASPINQLRTIRKLYRCSIFNNFVEDILYCVYRQAVVWGSYSVYGFSTLQQSLFQREGWATGEVREFFPTPKHLVSSSEAATRVAAAP